MTSLSAKDSFFFVLLVSHGRIATNLYRSHIGITSNDMCSWCDQFSESILHLLRDCSHSRSTRVGSISPSKRAGTGSLGYWRIIGSNGILSLPEICALLQTIGASCFWPAYGLSGKKRTKQCSIQNRFRLLKLLTKLPYWLLIWNYMTAVNSRWCKPIPSYYKLNVDGSFGDGSTAFGGVLRDEQGNWVWGFADNSNMQSVLAAELLALRTGLQLLLDEGCVLL